MFLRILFSVVFVFFVLGILSAQNNVTARTLTLIDQQDSVFLDSLIVVPNSLIIKTADDQILDSSFYTLNTKTSWLFFQKPLSSVSFPLTCTFQIFPFDLRANYFHKKWEMKPVASADSSAFFAYYSHKVNNEDRGLLGLSDFQKSGSISRAISVGNSQNLSVMSNMNLQIAGKITEELEIIASISDDNIPIQPDGNTQQLQDFDKVFIQLKHQNGQITAGDFEMLRPKSYFLNYYKKAQGANASGNFTLKNKSKLNVYGSIALSKGKYNSNDIIGIEGNQGPYKLIGANFERAIIVLSGTERVFVDGHLLERGQNNDYIIDYNTAEITFMPTFPINKDKRISIEFQYSDRNYARYLTNVGAEYSSAKWKWATHYYAESDLQNQPLDQNLSISQEQLLYGIGDSLHLAISESADSIGFNGNEVLYKKVDSLGFSPVYIYSTSADSAFYRLSFSLVGAGNGNYIQEKSSANGRVFKWVIPVNGIKQGDYEPVVLLVTPKKKQMISFLADYKIAKNTNLHAEMAVSNEDLNIISPYDKADNTAPALKLSFKNKVDLSKNAKPWTLNTNAEYEFVDANFKPIERFRNVEFTRDWNGSNAEGNTQHLAGLDLQLKQEKTGVLQYQYQYFVAGDSYLASRNTFVANVNKNQWFLKTNISLTKTDEIMQSTQYLRHQVGIEKRFKKFQVGISENAENNQFKSTLTDTLMLNSFKFQEIETFIQNPDSSRQKLRLHYKWRNDFVPWQTKMYKAMAAHELGLNYTVFTSTANRLSLVANYRQLQVVDSTLTQVKPEETAMGRIEHSLNLAKGSVTAQSFYQLGSGMETKKDFSYIEVAAGQGVYSWIDYNNNGVKELNEFEVAAFQDQANFIRVYVPGTNYIKTFNNQFSTSIMLNPSRVWRKSESKFLRAISLFSNQLVYRSSLKTLNEDWKEYAKPFFQNINDLYLINLNSAFRNTIYFQRGHSKYGADYSYLTNKNKVLMMNGYEGRSKIEHQLKLRWNINRKYMIQADGSMGNKVSVSDYFKNKEFDIQYYETSIKLTYQPNRVFRLAFPFSIGEKQNELKLGNQLSQSYKMGVNAKYNMLNEGSINLSAQGIFLNYNAPANDAIAFEMLEGLLPGQNYTWTINYQRTLLKNLQLSLIYNGRKSEATNIIHVGSMQLRAFF